MRSRATAEHQRLDEARQAADDRKWRKWGTYLPERQWGTVREDYSADGEAWDYLPFDHAARRAYRWGDDGLLGFCDNRGLACFCVALWNGADPILKERLFGVSGKEGNHGEDVKELYWYLDATPTCSYARALYKYPQTAFPYEELRARSRSASKADPEPELLDTAAFADNRYFDVVVEYAKAEVNDVLVRITVTNRGPRRRPHRGAPAAVVSQHVELDARHPSPADAGARGGVRRVGRRDDRRRTWGPSGSTWRAPTTCSSPRTSRTRGASGAWPTRAPT